VGLGVAIGSSGSLSTLKLLGDPLSSRLIDPFLVQVARRLHDNPSSQLETLHVTSGASSCRPCVGIALRDLLRRNYTLHDVKVFCHYRFNGTLDGVKTLDATTRTEIDFFLSLNRNGRKRLLQDNNQHRIPREEWLYSFSIQAAQNLDVLFYYLKSNPWLFQFSAVPQCDINIQNGKATPHLVAEENMVLARENRALELEIHLLQKELVSLKDEKTKRKWGVRRLGRRFWRKKKS
jgi:hypothetical protein